jgi:hypothetical protein
MKYLVSAIALIVACTSVTAQKMRISSRIGASPNSLIITARAETPFNDRLAEFGVVVQVPKVRGGSIPVALPTVTVRSAAECPTCIYTTFPVINWQQSVDALSDPNWYLVKIGAVADAAAPVINMAAGDTRDVVEIVFQGSTAAAVDVRLAHLADGGPSTQYGVAILASGSTDLTNYVQMFYGPSIQPTVPFGDEGVGYSNLQFSVLAGVTLPINWLGFDAVKQGNDALLNWKVSGEENNHHYELQRSLNGTDFTTIGTVNKTGTGNGVKNYQYTDAGITGLGATVIYYRLKQVDVDGRNTISPTRFIRLNMRGNGQISVFPNPVKDGFYVNIPFENPDTKMVKLNLIGVTGQLIKSREISSLQATNYYFETKTLSLAAGQYQLQIFHDGQVLETKQLVVTNQ